MLAVGDVKAFPIHTTKGSTENSVRMVLSPENQKTVDKFTHWHIYQGTTEDIRIFLSFTLKMFENVSKSHTKHVFLSILNNCAIN